MKEKSAYPEERVTIEKILKEAGRKLGPVESLILIVVTILSALLLFVLIFTKIFLKMLLRYSVKCLEQNLKTIKKMQ